MTKGIRVGLVGLAVLAWTALGLGGAMGAAASGPPRSQGQTVYVPVYSHIYIGDKARPFLLAVTLSIRNLAPREAIVLTGVDYYNTEGKRIKQYLSQPVTLGPLASVSYIVQESDAAGGAGAKFVVTWQAAQAVPPPLLEGVMIGTAGQQGISFVTRGEVMSEP